MWSRLCCPFEGLEATESKEKFSTKVIAAWTSFSTLCLGMLGRERSVHSLWHSLMALTSHLGTKIIVGGIQELEFSFVDDFIEPLLKIFHVLSVEARWYLSLDWKPERAFSMSISCRTYDRWIQLGLIVGSESDLLEEDLSNGGTRGFPHVHHVSFERAMPRVVSGLRAVCLFLRSNTTTSFWFVASSSITITSFL